MSLEFNLNEMFEAEIQKRCGDILIENETLNGKISNRQLEYSNLQRELLEYKKAFEIDTQLVSIKDKIDEKNIRSLFNVLGLKHKYGMKCLTSGMHDEYIPEWFKLYWDFYEDKEEVLNYFDSFSIKYDKRIMNFIPPQYESKEFVMNFVKDTQNRYICNGQQFDGNGGFFYESVKACGFNLNNAFGKGSGSRYIPWQYVLSNENILDSEVFDLMCKYIKKDLSNSIYYFKIADYQKLDKEQLSKIAKLLPTKAPLLKDYHKTFIEKCTDVLIECPLLVDNFKDEIRDNEYSPFYFIKFPPSHQIEFTKRQTRFEDRLRLVKKSTLSKEQKVELMNELYNEKLTELE